MGKIIEVEVEKTNKKEDAADIYEGRKVIADLSISAKDIKSDVTLIVQTYNQLEKTKRCVESIIKYTTDVDYDIILIDNGSEPEVMEYFKSVPIEKKTIIHVNNNVGTAFPNEVISMNMLSKYVGYMTCDLIVTKNWLSNILKVMESDERIGMVNPLASNTYNMQDMDIEYDSYEEMQEKAAIYNVSNPAKWHERLRLITLGTVFRKECIYAIGWPITDVGFWHDFLDDDMAFRTRRAGYKAVLARDTWICHDHPKSERNFEKMEKSLNAGRKNFRQKYHDIDAWDDVNNYMLPLIKNYIKNPNVDKANILGIDVKCGTPILDIKNLIRDFGIYDAELSAFTGDEKYTMDLKTICNGFVVCDNEENLKRKLPYEYFDYIIFDKEINGYHEPMDTLFDAYMLLKKGGQLFFSLKNTFNVYSIMNMIGYDTNEGNKYYYDYSLDKLYRDLKNMNIDIKLLATSSQVKADMFEHKLARDVIATFCDEKISKEMCSRLIADKMYFVIEK